MENQPNPLLKEQYVALILGVSTSWLRKSRMSARLDAPPFIKIGRSVRYRIEDLEAYIASCERRNTLEEHFMRDQ